MGRESSTSGVSHIEEEERDAMEYCELSQRRFGDSLPETVTTSMPYTIRPKLKKNDLSNLNRIWNMWSLSRKRRFTRKYGHIASLMNVAIDDQMFQAVMQFYNPTFRCFTFNEVDMTPTIEEYTALLRIPQAMQDTVYLHKPEVDFKIILGNMFGIEATKLDSHVFLRDKVDRVHGVSSKFFESFLESDKDDDASLKAMALAIYGLIIFPRIGSIDGEIVKLFEQIEQGVNPIPAILAVTFESLNHIRTKGSGVFLGCFPLLNIWMKSHFKCMDSKFTNPFRVDRNPIEEFNLSLWPEQMSRDQWMVKLHGLTSSDVIWRAPWMLQEKMLYRCGEFPWVPLLGPWGCTSYAPALVRRQLGSKQFIPMTHGLSTINSYNNGTSGFYELCQRIVAAWRQTFRVQVGPYTDSATVSYLSWHAKRGSIWFFTKEGLIQEQAINEPEDHSGDSLVVKKARQKSPA